MDMEAGPGDLMEFCVNFMAFYHEELVNIKRSQFDPKFLYLYLIPCHC